MALKRSFMSEDEVVNYHHNCIVIREQMQFGPVDS